MDKLRLKNAVFKYLQCNNIGQQGLAVQADVSQAVISRALCGKWVRYAGAIQKLGIYLGLEDDIVDPRRSDGLMKALGELWDGTAEGEAAIISLLFSVRNLGFKRSEATQSESRNHQGK